MHKEVGQLEKRFAGKIASVRYEDFTEDPHKMAQQVQKVWNGDYKQFWLFLFFPISVM